MCATTVDRCHPDWKTLCELIGDVAAQRTVDASLDLLVGEMEDLVPADRSVSVMEMHAHVPVCIRWPTYAEPLVPRFNEYLNTRSPLYYAAPYHVLGPTDWNEYRDTEYHNEFNRPLHLRYSLGVGLPDRSSGRQYALFVHRGSSGPAFGDTDAHVLRAIRKPLMRLLSLISANEPSCAQALREREAAPGCCALTAREAEIAELLCKRQTMREIASRLEISPRTVERHALHVYEKLNVSGRLELSRLLIPQPVRIAET